MLENFSNWVWLNLYCPFYRTVIYPMITFYYNVKWFFKNLFHYFRFLYSDRPWDRAFLYNMLAIKLESMKDEIGGFEGEEEVKKDLGECVDIMRRLYDDKYDDKILDDLELEYGKHTVEFTKIDKSSNLREMKSYFEKETEENKKEIHEKYINGLRKAEEEMQKDLDRFAEIFAKKSRSWWC